ncbi:hypothetical protein BDN70DRAFT_870940 [Pholiota conissans]|uniref:Zn(2)-C6 fungal-type domain-containing protein n=1 Tax=Pholiota conissans TaxID=109636 RepID=A0A9P5ZDW1_9AGAR|nr:hypothetical protein BDN70DRAFT_870940 [Pholiota conissans]
MPQAARKDAQTQRAQDKESKRARGALSCAECRRLKLKCDKTVPCSSCKRRGCSAICPNGSLITGQGTRFVLADTEALHQKIAFMSDRIRQLEDALAILQTTVAGPEGEPHPLLHRDLLKIKSSIELHAASGSGGQDELKIREDDENDAEEELDDVFGTLAIRDDGAATFYGRSAGSESLLMDATSASTSSAYPTSEQEFSPPPPQYNASPSGSHYQAAQAGYPRQLDASYSTQQYPGGNAANLQSSITALASSFPLAPSLSDSMSSPSTSSTIETSGAIQHLQRQITLDVLVQNFLPPYAETVHLLQSYLELAPWFFGAVTKRQIEEEIMPLWYEEASSPSASGAAFPTSASSSAVAKRQRTSHDLALLFVLCCFGALNDVNLPSAPDNMPAEKFYQLTKASLSLDPGGANGVDPKLSRNGLLERPPSVATVQTLSLMAIYEGMCSGENSIETTWALMGLACKLAQSIGLHRDCARWKLTPAEVQKRRALFWELFITDCWQSLATGRLATFSLPFVDSELPLDPDQTMADDGSVIPSFPFWKARFGAECVSAVVQGTLTSRAPKYSIILDLDRKVRDMELPAYAQGQPPKGVGLAQTMSHFMPHNYRELTLLYIHRCFFAHAISSHPLDPIKSQYAPSFLAGYRSACTILSSVKQQFTLFPAQIARFWVLWTHAFSASVMLASVVTNGSRSKIAPAALLEFNNACELFQTASGYGGRAVKFLPILRRLQMKAHQALREANSGNPPSIPNDIFKPSKPGNKKDEMSIFSGKTHTVTTKTTTSPPSNRDTTIALSSSGSSSRASSDSPSQIFVDNPQFANVHPSLVSELSTFHGHIKAQIQNAHRNGELYADTPMMVDPGPSNRALAISSTQQVSHQQLHQQAMYQQQQQKQQKEAERLERLQREREEAERREIGELERQEVARKQQLQQQLEIQRQYTQQQQEMQRQQQEQQELQRQQQQQQQDMLQQQAQQQRQLELQRQQEKQQQRQEQYRQRTEAQQQQMHQQHPTQYRQPVYEVEASHAHPAYNTRAPVDASGHPMPAHHVQPLSQMHNSHHQPPPPVASQSYQAPPLPAHGHAQYHHPTQVAHPPSIPHPNQQVDHGHAVQSHYVPPPSAQQPPPAVPQQHSMYQAPQEYHPNTTTTHTGPPSTTYREAHPSTYSQPEERTYPQETYTYWPAATGSFNIPDQQYATSTYATAHPPAHNHPLQQYTPENALRGIAADDRSLQETWQSYMEKVGSPRQFFED